jgi:hypothetical protein
MGIEAPSSVVVEWVGVPLGRGQFLTAHGGNSVRQCMARLQSAQHVEPTAVRAA